ncbi:hypothetical protein MRB53_040514 [Persea americana]|nr:hypothetical protein MRB53_040514 [Persea americana]
MACLFRQRHSDELDTEKEKEYATFSVPARGTNSTAYEVTAEQAEALLLAATKDNTLSLIQQEQARQALTDLRAGVHEKLESVQSVLNDVGCTLEDLDHPDVQGVVLPTDDTSMPVNTFRSWSIGLLFSVIGAAINGFFAERLPESIIVTQRLPIFYNQSWASSWVYQILLVLSTQIMGYGLAGIVRKALVYPASAIWPGTLAVIALNRSFHEDVNLPANGWRVSRLRWFAYTFLGLGINPVPTLDYNMVSGIVDPFITPFSAVCNLYGGMLLTGLVLLPSIWFSNTWFSAHLPIVGNNPFDHFAKPYNVTRILSSEGRLNVTAFEDYSPVYLSAANALAFGGYFAIYPATLVYAYLYHGSEIANAFKNMFGRGKKVKADVHMKLMSAYKEVPEWWYLSIMAAGAGMGFVMIGIYPTDMPVWGVFFAIAVGLLFIVPIGLILAVSNVGIALNVLAEIIAGFAIPGKPLAMMIFKAYGTITISQGLSFASDLKLGHYCKIPPRTMFTAQLIGTLLSAFVTLGISNWQINNLEGYCLPGQKQKFTCPGAVIPIPIYYASKRWPRSIISQINTPVFLYGLHLFVPLNLSYITAAVPVAYVFNVYIRRRAYAWWTKYNYITAVGLSSGIAIAGLLAFIALQNPGVNLDWVGNRIATSGCDAAGCALLPLAPGEHFGPGVDDEEEEDAAAVELREKRLAEYAAKKAGKTKVAAKSVVTMDVKPWDETDMTALEAAVRAISMDGLVWGGSKLVPVGYGVSKLQINLVIEDDKVGLDDLQDAIAENEDYVQSSDIAAMQKL